MEINRFYKAFAPRLTVLVTTIDGKGKENAAPLSFVMPVSMDPPLFAISSSHGGDTLKNIQETGQFVVNLLPEENLKQLYECGKGYDSEINELEKAQLETIQSKEISPPRVKEALCAIECALCQEAIAGDHVILVGEVVMFHKQKDVFDKNSQLDIEKARVPLHLTGKKFAVAERKTSID